jgi:AmiR/NasT family two-component response regulator
MPPHDPEDLRLIQELRDEVAVLLADALQLGAEVAAETERAQQAHDREVANLGAALMSRDVIGQAKGIIMVTTHCTADKAFALLVAQSQAQQRKLVEIATELAERVSRRAKPDGV